jgi:murein DD-endopeptidase MepM/ murein hydrolase activator NlpD
LSEKQYPTWVVLGLIQIESNGNAAARRREGSGLSEYCGLLQIGIKNAIDCGRRNTDHLPSAFPASSDPLQAAGERSIDSFFHYAERYSKPTKTKLRHNYEPEKLSILWKSGPGALNEYAHIQRDEGQAAAEAYLRTLFGSSSEKYLKLFRGQAQKWGDGKTTYAAPAVPLPISGKRQGGAPSSSGLPDCPPRAGAPVIATPNPTLAQTTQSNAEEALLVSQEGGATGFKTDPVDPAVQAGARTRQIRVLNGDRFDVVAAVFPAATEAVDYVTPLAKLSVSTGFGTPVGNGHLAGVEYDTSEHPNQTVHAVAAGTVVGVAVTEARGNVVTVNHDGYLVSEYGHLGEVLVASGDAVAPGDIVARAGQTLGSRASGELVAVARARRDPVLYFELRGDVSLFEAGTTSQSVDFGTRPLPIDPNAVMLAAPAPGEVRSQTRVEVALITESRDGYAELAMTASTPDAQVEAEGAYDMVVGMSRACEMADMSRAAYSLQEDSQRVTRTAFGNTALALNGTDY